MKKMVESRKLGCIPDLSPLKVEISGSLDLGEYEFNELKAKTGNLAEDPAMTSFLEESLEKINGLRTIDAAYKVLDEILRHEKDKIKILKLAQAAKIKILRVAVGEKLNVWGVANPEGLLEEQQAIYNAIAEIRNRALANLPAKYHHANQMTVISYEILCTNNFAELCEKLEQLIKNQVDLDKINQYVMYAHMKLRSLIEERLQADPQYAHYLPHQLAPIKTELEAPVRKRLAEIVLAKKLELTGKQLERETLVELLGGSQEFKLNPRKVQFPETNLGVVPTSVASSSLSFAVQPEVKEVKRELKVNVDTAPSRAVAPVRNDRDQMDRAVKVLAKLMDIAKPFLSTGNGDSIPEKLVPIFIAHLKSLNLTKKEYIELSNLSTEMAKLAPDYAQGLVERDDKESHPLSYHITCCSVAFGIAAKAIYADQVIEPFTILDVKVNSEKTLSEAKGKYGQLIYQVAQAFKKEYKSGTPEYKLLEEFETDSMDFNANFPQLVNRFLTEISTGSLLQIGTRLEMFILMPSGQTETDSLNETVSDELSPGVRDCVKLLAGSPTLDSVGKRLPALQEQSKQLLDQLSKVESTANEPVKTWKDYLHTGLPEGSDLTPEIYDGIYNLTIDALDSSILELKEEARQKAWRPEWPSTVKARNLKLKQLEELKKSTEGLHSRPLGICRNFKKGLK